MKLLGFLSKSHVESNSELPEIFPLALQCQIFVDADIKATFTKILTDTLERTHGIPKEVTPLLFDNCVQNESQFGLITLLVEAMVSQSDLFIVYKKALKTIRKATFEEQEKIKNDYKTKGESESGVYISFRNYRRTQMLKIYSELEYCILASLHKTVNISKAVQIKVSKLRDSVSLADAGLAEAQARAIAVALRRGSDVFLDKEDEITTATPDVSPTEKAIGFLDAKRAFYLDLPISYISGVQTGGIGSTGEADTRAIERGLKQYFFSIIEPVLNAVFGIETEFQSQDFRQLTTALEALKTFELVSDNILTNEAKKQITARLFDLDVDQEEKARVKEEKERLANPPVLAAAVND